jgi:hypothetical protein
LKACPLPVRVCRWLACATAALSLLAAPSSLQAQDRAPPAGIFKPLRVGQKVTLVEKPAAGMEIRLLNDGAWGSHSIVEIAAGHIVLEDLVAVSRVWIPVTSIRSVVWMRVREGAAPPVWKD